MKCEEIRELLSLYIDKSLDENEMKAVEAHLASCEDCGKECAELEEMAILLGQTEMMPVPDAFNLRLKAALREEKQAMLEAGILVKSNKKKHQWRIITSVAAVFAVGVLSFGLYHDVLGVLPDHFSGREQTETVQPGSENKIKIADDAAKADQPPENTGGSEDFTASTEKKPLQMSMAKLPDTAGSDAAQSKKQASGEVKYGKLNDEKTDKINTSAIAQDAGDTKEQASGGAAASSDTTNQAAVADLAGSAPEALSNSEDGTDAVSGSGSNEIRYGAASAPNECSRSMTVPGIERNTAAVQYYNKLIEARLEGFDYQILDSNYTQAGEWRFRVFIFRGKDGNTYNEEITVIGKDGKIAIVCSNKFTGLIN